MLNRKQLAFCREYIVDYIGKNAAIRAGYKESDAASRASKLLKNPEVLEEIQNLQKELLKSSCLTAEKLINDVQKVKEQCMAAVPVMEWDYSEHEYVETGLYQFDSKGALKAIEMLGKYLGGIFDEKLNVEISLPVFNGEDELED